MTLYNQNNNSDNIGKEYLSIKSLLNHLGLKPVDSLENESFYTNVFLKTKFIPKTFKLDHALDVWFDKSLEKGGNIIDFARIYWPHLSSEEIDRKLTEYSSIPQYHHLFPINDKPRRKRKPIKLPHYQVDRIRNLGFSNEITEYLWESGLWESADSNLFEVHYYVLDQKGKRKDFCAAGWQNENGGWEVRARHFESCLGLKGITIFPGSERVLAVFPGYLDYLKKRSDNQLPYISALILNHPDFLYAAIKRARHFGKVLLYVDETRIADRLLGEAFKDEVPNTEVIPL